MSSLVMGKGGGSSARGYIPFDDASYHINDYDQPFDANHDYREAIWFSAGVFALAGIVALGLDAKRPVVREAA